MEKERTVRERHPEERRFLEQEKKSAESEKRGGCLRGFLEQRERAAVWSPGEHRLVRERRKHTEESSCKRATQVLFLYADDSHTHAILLCLLGIMRSDFDA